ncbi:MAG: hypothetical protein Tsb0020_38370 [Haliangiales bacterium]
MKSDTETVENPHLPEANRGTRALDERWEGTNEQWWDWYLSLADNSEREARPDDGDPVELDEAKMADIRPLTRDELRAEMAEPYPLTAAQVQGFQSDSYLRLTDFFSPGAIVTLRREAQRIFYSHNDPDPTRRFSSMELMWLESETIRDIVTGRRLGQLAASLLRVPRVRIYHDDFLCKEPGGGRTPWHYDGHHYPIASGNVGTAWIPLQPTSAEMGMLELAEGMKTHEIVRDTPFDKFSHGHDRAIWEALVERAVAIDRRPFALGEISFQHCLNVHGASANRTSAQRLAYGASYFEDGARVSTSPTLISGDWQKFMPGVAPGEPICSAYNPLVFDDESSETAISGS